MKKIHFSIIISILLLETSLFSSDFLEKEKFIKEEINILKNNEHVINNKIFDLLKRIKKSKDKTEINNFKHGRKVLYLQKNDILKKISRFEKLLKSQKLLENFDYSHLNHSKIYDSKNFTNIKKQKENNLEDKINYFNIVISKYEEAIKISQYLLKTETNPDRNKEIENLILEYTNHLKDLKQNLSKNNFSIDIKKEEDFIDGFKEHIDIEEAKKIALSKKKEEERLRKLEEEKKIALAKKKEEERLRKLEEEKKIALAKKKEEERLRKLEEEKKIALSKKKEEERLRKLEEEKKIALAKKKEEERLRKLEEEKKKSLERHNERLKRLQGISYVEDKEIYQSDNIHLLAEKLDLKPRSKTCKQWSFIFGNKYKFRKYKLNKVSDKNIGTLKKYLIRNCKKDK